MSKFKDGDAVYIADGSDYYIQGVRDGVKMRGIIKGDEGRDGWYQVEWDDGDRNTYRAEDLVHASDATVKIKITEHCGFEVGETVECGEHGYGMGSDQLGKLFIIVEFGDYAGDPGVKLKYKSNGKTYPNPMYNDFVDIRSIRKTQSMQSISQDPDKPETEVYFTLDDVTYVYQLESTYYNRAGVNDVIFELLGVNKYEFCSKAYGYEASSGDWPTWRYGDKEAPIKIIKAIREAIAKLGITKTDITAAEPDFDAILAEARRSYPVGTRYRPLSSTGTERGGTETSFRDCRWINGHEGGKMGIDCGIGYVYILKTDTWAEVIDQPVATKEPKEPELLDLLAEARRRYPVGTYYNPLDEHGNAYAVEPRRAVRECEWVTTGHGIDCGMGYVYVCGKWADIPGITSTGTVSAGTGTVSVGTTNPNLQVSSIIGTYSNPHGTAPAGILYDSTPPQFITVSGTIDLNSMARKTLPDMQDPIIVKRNKQRTKLTVL